MATDIEAFCKSCGKCQTTKTDTQKPQGYMPQIRMPTSFDTTFKGVKQFVLQAKWDLMAAHNMIITNHVQQTFHANKKHHTSDLYHVGDHMYLLT